MVDRGLTHVALETVDSDRSVAFYARYAGMEVVHRRGDEHGSRVVWLSDRTRPFVIVLVERPEVTSTLRPWAHLGVACASRDDVDRLCAEAASEGVLVSGPEDSGPPVGYWAFLRDPDGHTLELSYGQEVGLTVDESGADGQK
jgi:catechol 2,3-dioxygenase-like lactoylglutathione lyase family enzyme